MTERLICSSIADLDRGGILGSCAFADAFEEVSQRPIPKVPTLRGQTVATLFFDEPRRGPGSPSRPPQSDCRPTR